MNSETTAFCFAQRMLNPFHGAMHIVRLKWSEAVTTDGRNWTLYVRGEKFYDDLQENNKNHIIVPDIKYGQWSESAGLSRSPVRLTTYYDEIDFEGRLLLNAVKSSTGKLPFAYLDHHELWLLDETTQRPLALIGSRCEHETEELPALIRWTAGQAATAFYPELDALQQQVTGLAGRQPEVQWFNRHDDILPATELAEDLLEHATDTLAQLYDWQSPYQLLLQHDMHHRMQLEKLAAGHATRLAEQLSLYPELVQPKLITTALVEARLRKSAELEAGNNSSDTAIPPFYLELGD